MSEGTAREVSRDEAQKLIDEGAQLVDVRADHEWEAGRIAGAIARTSSATFNQSRASSIWRLPNWRLAKSGGGARGKRLDDSMCCFLRNSLRVARAPFRSLAPD